MNVALTRARSSLFILGDSNKLQSNRWWSSLVNDAQSRGLLAQVRWTRASLPMQKTDSSSRRSTLAPSNRSQPRSRQSALPSSHPPPSPSSHPLSSLPSSLPRSSAQQRSQEQHVPRRVALDPSPPRPPTASPQPSDRSCRSSHLLLRWSSKSRTVLRRSPSSKKTAPSSLSRRSSSPPRQRLRPSPLDLLHHLVQKPSRVSLCPRRCVRWI